MHKSRAVAAAVMAACLCLALPSFSAPPAGGDKGGASAVDQSKVDLAIDKGAKRLLAIAAQLPNGGGWHNEKPNADFWHDELILYTLIHAGVDRSDPVFQKLLDRALNEPLTRTYRVSLTAMALQALGDEDYLPRIVDCAQYLVDNQCDNGQWSYGEPVPLVKRTFSPSSKPKVTLSGGSGPADSSAKSSGSSAKSSSTKARKRIPVTQRRKGGPTGDNSNSQYAALGVRACMEAGVDIQVEVLKRAKDWWEDEQNDDGGWNYGEKGGTSFGSMTTGGVGCLAIYKFFLRENFKNDPRVANGLRWMDQNFTVKENPKDNPEEWDRQFYYLYAMERVGMLVGIDKIGKHDWYAEGAAYLLEKQEPDGHWHGEKAKRNATIDTCYAILFLRRATKPLPKMYTK
jgi:hypothetical protein